jgi:hypothetical protein
MQINAGLEKLYEEKAFPNEEEKQRIKDNDYLKMDGLC